MSLLGSEEVMFHSTILLVCVLALMLISTAMARNPCGPVCAMYCPYGNVLDRNGCPMCICKPSPCPNGQEPLQDVFCIPLANRQRCPRTHRCVADRRSFRGFCCPRRM